MSVDFKKSVEEFGLTYDVYYVPKTGADGIQYGMSLDEVKSAYKDLFLPGYEPVEIAASRMIKIDGEWQEHGYYVRMRGDDSKWVTQSH